MIKVTQADRDAAHILFARHHGDDFKAMRDGAWDEHEFVQAFAAHRIAALKAAAHVAAREVFKGRPNVPSGELETARKMCDAIQDLGERS